VLSLLAALLWAAAYAPWLDALLIDRRDAGLAGALATGAVSSRHFGEWREPRALLARYRDTVSREAPDGGRLLARACTGRHDARVLAVRRRRLRARDGTPSST
jgi:hypothetical protein